MASRPLALILVVAALAAPAAAVQPVVVYVDGDAGHFWSGSAVAGIGGTGNGDPAGLGEVSARHYDVKVDQCHRSLWFALHYDPDHVGVDLGENSAGLGFTFRVELRNDALAFSAAADVASPGDAFPLGVAPVAGNYAVDVWMKTGADVDWTFTLRGLDVLRFAPNAWEPACARIRVTEVEANPLGADIGNEWVELHNEELATVDISGWRIDALHNTPSRMDLPASTILAPGAYLRVPVGPGQFLDNTDEEVALVNVWGVESDRTPLLSDEANDARTNQWVMAPDGSMGWTFTTGTPGQPN